MPGGGLCSCQGWNLRSVSRFGSTSSSPRATVVRSASMAEASEIPRCAEIRGRISRQLGHKVNDEPLLLYPLDMAGLGISVRLKLEDGVSGRAPVRQFLVLGPPRQGFSPATVTHARCTEGRLSTLYAFPFRVGNR